MSRDKNDYFKAISSAVTQEERESLLRQFDEEVLTPLEENFKSVSSLAALAEQKLGEGYMLTIKAAAKELRMSKKAFVKWLLKGCLNLSLSICLPYFRSVLSMVKPGLLLQSKVWCLSVTLVLMIEVLSYDREFSRT